MAPHLAKLLEIDFEKPAPIPEVQIYLAQENEPEQADSTLIFEELPEKRGGFLLAFGLVLSGCGFLDSANIVLMLMTQGPALLCVCFGFQQVRKFAQLRIDTDQSTMTYRCNICSSIKRRYRLMR